MTPCSRFVDYIPTLRLRGWREFVKRSWLAFIEPIIDPFFCLLNEAESRFGLCRKSIPCSTYDESPKPSGFGVFNGSSCAPVKSDGTSLYCESDSVPAILVRFCHCSPYPKAKAKSRTRPKPGPLVHPTPAGAYRRGPFQATGAG